MPTDAALLANIPLPDDRLLTYREAADLLVLSPRTLQRAAKDGQLRVLTFGHRTVRIRRSDLCLWVGSKSNIPA